VLKLYQRSLLDQIEMGRRPSQKVKVLKLLPLSQV